MAQQTDGGGSPVAHRAWHPSTPEQPLLNDEARNSTQSLRDALTAAKAHHDRVQAAARRTLELYNLQEQHRQVLEDRRANEARIKMEQQIMLEQQRLAHEKLARLQIEQRKEEERIAGEKRQAEEVKKLHALQAQKIPIPDPPKPQPPPAPQPSSQPSAPAVQLPATQQATAKTSSIGSLLNGPASNGVFQEAPKTTKTPATILQAASTQIAYPRQDARVVQIHKNLKQLRAFMGTQAKTNQLLKSRLGDMRRAIVKNVGQLTLEAAKNKGQLIQLTNLLKESLTIPCDMVEPNNFLLTPRGQEAKPEDPAQLPSLFIYLLNIFSKAVVSQFANECGSNLNMANPIGITAVQVFSKDEFLWRDKSLVDILLVKMLIACPVLAGAHGDESTPAGKIAVGWRKDAGGFVDENQHLFRMTGLGNGWAALTLRDFSKAKAKAPLPPHKYWESFARICNTPSEQLCNTHFLVLKAMIEGHEQRFFLMYGDIAKAALRTALIDLPARAPNKNSSVNALKVYGELLHSKTGFPY